MKKLMALLLALALTFGAAVMPVSAAYSDVSDAELTAKLDLLSALGVVGGYPDGSFKPARALTRAQFTKLVVTLLGKDEASLSYADYTYFPDVRSGHWSARYVNYATRVLSLIKGDGSGHFNPDNAITYREAVTLVMRALGYTDEIVGGRWPDGYFAKAAALGLTKGISLGATQAVDRRTGAELFYNALYTEIKAGGTLISSLAGELRTGTLILSVSATAPDGSKNAILTAAGAVVKTKNAFSASLVGRRGTLIIDSTGVAVGFVPESQTVMELIISRTDSGSLTAASGEYLRVKSTAPVYSAGASGAASTWASSWYSLGAGTTVRVVIGADGAVEYIAAYTASASTDAVVLESVPTMSALCSMLGAPQTAKIIKNGVASDISDLRRHDVVTYNKTSGIISVSDFRLSVIYEGANPSSYTPDSVIAFGGNTFPALECAAKSLRTFSLGSAMTLLFTADGQVAAAMSSAVASDQPGYYDGSSVLFPSGVSIKATLNADAGSLVRVYQTAAGKLASTTISVGAQGYGAFDVAGMKLAGSEVLAGALIYERLGRDGALRRISLSDLTAASVPGSQVLYVSYDSAGRVNLMVLDDVTGNGYVYGMLTSSAEKITSGSLGSTYVNYITIVNSDGSVKHEATSSYNLRGEWGAVALSADGRVQYVKSVESYKNVTLSDFSGASTVRLAGALVRFADDVQVYAASSGAFLKSSDYGSTAELIGSAKNMGSSFTMLLDRAPADGGLVRAIIVE